MEKSIEPEQIWLSRLNFSSRKSLETTKSKEFRKRTLKSSNEIDFFTRNQNREKNRKSNKKAGEDFYGR